MQADVAPETSTTKKGKQVEFGPGTTHPYVTVPDATYGIVTGHPKPTPKEPAGGQQLEQLHHRSQGLQPMYSEDSLRAHDGITHHRHT